MDFPFLPAALIRTCDAIVRANSENRRGTARVLWHRDTMAFIATHHDLFVLLRAATSSFKIRQFLWVAAIVAFLGGAFLNLWIAIGLIPIAALERYFAKQEADSYSFIAAIILALEITATDFAGWGARFAEACRCSKEIFAEYLPGAQTRLLDLYLPNRGLLAPAEIEVLSPNAHVEPNGPS